MLKSLIRKQKTTSPKGPTIRERIQAESLTASAHLNTPDDFGHEMKSLALKYESYPPYFDCLEFEGKFLRPFLKKSADFIINNVQDKNARILDICGGAGNQGLALALEGFNNYVLADIDEDRMAWGALLWKKAGKTLKWQREDALNMTFADSSFDVLTLLGWEAPVLPYSYTFRECMRVLKPGGHFIFTFHEVEGIVEGNWDFDPERKYSFLPYSISRPALYLLCERMGLEVLSESESGYDKFQKDFFPDETPRHFPQYVMYTRKKA